MVDVSDWDWHRAHLRDDVDERFAFEVTARLRGKERVVRVSADAVLVGQIDDDIKRFGLQVGIETALKRLYQLRLLSLLGDGDVGPDKDRFYLLPPGREVAWIQPNEHMERVDESALGELYASFGRRH